jgi:hypothetical protein
MRSLKSKEVILLESFKLFVTNDIPKHIFDEYINDKDGEGTANFQVWIVDNMNDNISDWCTGIGIIDAVELLYKVAEENGNLQK